MVADFSLVVQGCNITLALWLYRCLKHDKVFEKITSSWAVTLPREGVSVLVTH